MSAFGYSLPITDIPLFPHRAVGMLAKENAQSDKNSLLAKFLLAICHVDDVNSSSQHLREFRYN